MNNYKKSEELFSKFREFAKIYNITIITATQIPRKESSITFPIRKDFNVLVIDHSSLIKNEK